MDSYSFAKMVISLKNIEFILEGKYRNQISLINGLIYNTYPDTYIYWMLVSRGSGRHEKLVVLLFTEPIEMLVVLKAAY